MMNGTRTNPRQTNARQTNPRQYKRSTVPTLDSTNARQYKPQTGTNARQVQTLDSTNPRQIQTLDRYKPQTDKRQTCNLIACEFMNLRFDIEEIKKSKMVDLKIGIAMP